MYGYDAYSKELDRELLVGVKVSFVSVMRKGLFPSEILEVSETRGAGNRPVCTVKLECQTPSVKDVLYYD